MKNETGTFQTSIHDEDFLEQFSGGRAGWEGLISGAGRDTEKLNGTWNFSLDPYQTCLRAGWYLEASHDASGREYPLDYDFDQWEPVPVPSCWNLLKKEYLWYEGPAVYTRKFTYVNRGEKTVVLKIGAANYDAKVFVNQRYVGHHRGGSTPFCFDITSFLGHDNRIVIVVDNTRNPNHVPMTNTDWFNYGGLYRDVELLRLPKVAITDFSVALVPDGAFDKLRASVTLSDPSCGGQAVVTIAELGLRQEIPVRNGQGEVTFGAKPELWGPESPRLYDVEVRFGEDVVTDRIGFREIRVAGTEIRLNGRAIVLKGICIHEESEANGKSVTDEEIRENFRLLKDLNANYARLAHYPHSENAARIADEMGILLWEEIPVYWAIHFRNKDTYADAENQLLELIRRDKNRASVILWSVGNENPDTDDRLNFMKSLALRAKAVDGSRLVTAACLVDRVNLIINDRLADSLDVIGINEYYGWYEPNIEHLQVIFDHSKPTKPVIISEFGADARAGERGSKDDLWTEDKQLEVYRIQTQTFAKIPYIKGTTPWILFDFRCPRRTNGFQDFYNRKGLLSQDKKTKKLAYFCMKAYYSR